MNSVLHATPDISEEAGLRADIYALLASLLRQAPSHELLSFLSEVALEENAQGEMVQAWQLLKLAAQHSNTNALESEYLKLFIGITQGELTPFASWYLTGSLMEAPLIELRKDLDLLGFVRAEPYCEPEDHIAALCEVMNLLIQQGASHERQAVFYQRHLASWGQTFFADLAKAPSAVFYNAVALLGQAFFKTETISLQKQPDAVQSVRLSG